MMSFVVGKPAAPLLCAKLHVSIDCRRRFRKGPDDNTNEDEKETGAATTTTDVDDAIDCQTKLLALPRPSPAPECCSV